MDRCDAEDRRRFACAAAIVCLMLTLLLLPLAAVSYIVDCAADIDTPTSDLTINVALPSTRTIVLAAPSALCAVGMGLSLARASFLRRRRRNIGGCGE